MPNYIKMKNLYLQKKFLQALTTNFPHFLIFLLTKNCSAQYGLLL